VTPHAGLRDSAPGIVRDTGKAVDVSRCLGCESRGGVDRLLGGALAAGGPACGGPEGVGFIRTHGLVDPDGHGRGCCP